MSGSGNSPTQPRPNRRFVTARVVFWLMVAIAALLLLYEHRMHVLGYWPLAIFLLCPLLHFWMHRGRHGGDRSGGHRH